MTRTKDGMEGTMESVDGPMPPDEDGVVNVRPASKKKVSMTRTSSGLEGMMETIEENKDASKSS